MSEPTQELKPCPFCGGSNLGTGMECCVICYDCSSEGPWDAPYTWNTRADDTSPAIANDAPAAELTIEKVKQCIKRDGSKITGYVLTDKHGDVAIIDKSAVRWLGQSELWWLMHDSESPIHSANDQALPQAGRE